MYTCVVLHLLYFLLKCNIIRQPSYQLRAYKTTDAKGYVNHIHVCFQISGDCTYTSSSCISLRISCALFQINLIQIILNICTGPHWFKYQTRYTGARFSQKQL